MGIVDVTIRLMGCFSDLEDTRDASKRRHKLNDMIAIAIAAVICGANEWTSIAAFGRAKFISAASATMPSASPVLYVIIGGWKTVCTGAWT